MLTYDATVTPRQRDKRAPFEKSVRTRARILDAAAEVFSRQGYAGTRLSDIADEAGIKQGSLYYYFDSKDDLVEEMLAVGVQKTYAHVLETVEALGESATELDKIRAAIEAHAESVVARVGYTAASARIVGQLPPQIRRKHISSHQRPYGKLWHELLVSARDAGAIGAELDLEALRLLIIGALNWTVEWPSKIKRSPSEVSSILSSVIFDGISTPPKRRRNAASPKGNGSRR